MLAFRKHQVRVIPKKCEGGIQCSEVTDQLQHRVDGLFLANWWQTETNQGTVRHGFCVNFEMAVPFLA